ATVRNRTALSGVASAAIDSPLRRYPLRQTLSSAPVTPVSSVIRSCERATPEIGADFRGHLTLSVALRAVGVALRPFSAAVSRRRVPCHGPWRPRLLPGMPRGHRAFPAP